MPLLRPPCPLCHTSLGETVSQIHRPTQLYVYFDSSDADYKITGKSTDGKFVIFLNGILIAWRSGRQSIVTLSTCESEYVQATLTAIEILHLRETLDNMGFKQDTTVCYQDNHACIKLSENPVARGKTKHIKRRFHFIRQCVSQGEIRLEPISTHLQISDIFTKPLPVAQFLYLRDKLLNLQEEVRTSYKDPNRYKRKAEPSKDTTASKKRRRSKKKPSNSTKASDNGEDADIED